VSRFQTEKPVGTVLLAGTSYRSRTWATCPEDNTKRAQEVVVHLPEPLNAKQRVLHDEPGRIYHCAYVARLRP